MPVKSDLSELPLGRERAAEAVGLALRESRADATEALIMAENTSLTRFANLAIHQNVTEIRHQLLLRTIWNKRIVAVETNDLSPAGVRDALRRSRDLAEVIAPSDVLPDFGYPARNGSGDGDVTTFNPATAACGPVERAEILDRAIGVLRRYGVNGGGNARVRLLELAVGNSSGLFRYAPFSIVALVVAALDEERWSSGYQNWVGRDIERVDPEELAVHAASKCLMGRNPKTVEARPMTAILEPSAVAQLLFHLNFRSLGVFGANSAAVLENIVFEHIGEQITSPAITIRDDHLVEGMVPMPFDCEGVDKRQLDLIECGVARGIAHDLSSAAHFGVAPTGHAQPPGLNAETGSDFGPSPLHLVMEPGDSTVAGLIESTEYGVLVSRIHGFVSPLSSKSGYMAGTTRDGLFLIENGRITGPIRNFRWMDRIFSAFATVEGISKERRIQFTDELWFPLFALVPTIKLGSFNFVDTQRWDGWQETPGA